MSHPVSDTCACFSCVAHGTSYCARTKGCMLRERHGGACRGRLAFARLFFGEVKRRAVQKLRSIA